jgi:hypothetical protein
MTTVFKVLYLNSGTGEHGRLPDLGITNIGGTIGPTFFVGGKPLLFADGTSTDGSNTALLQNSLQGVYNSSTPATTTMESGKDIKWIAQNGNYINFNADTGKVTISGDLEILGSNVVADSSVRTYEHIQNIPTSTWNILHSKNSHNPTVTVFGTDGITVIPDRIQIVNNNEMVLYFNTAQAGRAVCIFFT